ncbi:MAG TPA: hypothetical protein VF810_03005 [Patescibacteria group bacterium]
MAAQPITASTQKFTEIIDFVGSTVILAGGNACLIIEVTASNFALLSQREKDIRVYSYAGLLNSLSFPIQILIRNKLMDISSYLQELDTVITNTKNEQLANYVKYYRSFIQEIVTLNSVLNKNFYIIIPYSSLEAGVQGVSQIQLNSKSQVEAFAQAARKTLEAKAETILGQVQKFSMSARILEKNDLIKLFYDLYNETEKIAVDLLEPGINATIITGGGKT